MVGSFLKFTGFFFDGGNSMKKTIARGLCLALMLSLSGCGTNIQSSNTHDVSYEKGYSAGYEAGYHDGKQQASGNEKHLAQFSGSFTATVEQLTSFRTGHFCFISRKT